MNALDELPASINKQAIAERFKEERKRLFRTQDDAAQACQATREHFHRIESAINVPGGAILAHLAERGADVQYILIGKWSANCPTETTGSRLRAERIRLEMNQTKFAEISGVQKNTQINYEQGKRSPDADYLAAIAKNGADVQYILTGQRSVNWPPEPNKQQ